MGNRVVVILYTDHCSEWSNDPDLGKKIMYGMNDAGIRGGRPFTDADLRYGMVAQLAHADTQTLAILDGYRMTTILHSFWVTSEDYEAKKLRLLKEAADKLGYTLHKKREKKSA